MSLLQDHRQGARAFRHNCMITTRACGGGLGGQGHRVLDPGCWNPGQWFRVLNRWSLLRDHGGGWGDRWGTGRCAGVSSGVLVEVVAGREVADLHEYRRVRAQVVAGPAVADRELGDPVPVLPAEDHGVTAPAAVARLDQVA